MSLGDEVRDPWALLTAGVSGGMAWAVAGSAAALAGGPAVAIGVGVGATVLGVKALTGLLVSRGERARRDLPRPPRDTAARHFLERAEVAAQSLDEMAATTDAGPTGTAVRSAADEAASTLTDLARVASQVTAVERALARVAVRGLDEEAARLEAAVRQARTSEMRAQVERSAAAVRDRVEVRNRLLSARETLLARMEAAALGLEGLGARLAEVLALDATTGGVDTSADQIADLALELDGLRAGLAETEALSRRALAAAPAEDTGR